MSAPTGNLVKWWPPVADEPTPSQTATHTRLLYDGINNHDQAITLLAEQVAANHGTAMAAAAAASGGGGGTVIINNNQFPGLGAVNNQTGVTAYTTQTPDNGALILVGDSSAIAVTLNSALTTPYFTSISNSGSSTATLTPTTGTINGGASLGVPPGSWVTVYFDGINWTAESPGATAGGVTQLTAGSNITLVPSSGMGVVQVSSAGGGGIGLPHDVTGSRAFGTIYQNTNSDAMWVTGYGLTSGSSTGAINVDIGPTSGLGQPVFGHDYTATVSSGKASFGFWVPPGYFYEAFGTGAITGVGLWVEYF